MCIYAYMYANRYRERQTKREKDRDGESLFIYRAKQIWIPSNMLKYEYTYQYTNMCIQTNMHM